MDMLCRYFRVKVLILRGQIEIAMDSIEKVFSAIQKAGKPVSAGQIVELACLDRKEVDKAMKKLKTEGKISSPKNCYWEPAK
jgi:hypothetical protein